MKQLFFIAVLMILSGQFLNAQRAAMSPMGEPRHIQENGAVMKTYSGKVIPVTVVAGADITMVPVRAELQESHIGWYQMGLSVHPVYEGAKGGWYLIRTSRNTG